MSDVAAPDTLDVRYVRSATFSLVALCILSLAKQKIEDYLEYKEHPRRIEPQETEIAEKLSNAQKIQDQR